MVNPNRPRSGQAIITLVMVVAVSLVVGVAVSSRVVTTLRQVSFAEQSAKALALAEAGAEDALLLIKDQPSLALPHSSGDVTVEDGHFNYTISALGQGTAFDDLSPLEREKAAQVNLDGYGGNSVNVYWVNSDDSGEMGDNRAALEISLVYQDGVEYKLKRDAYDPIQELGRGLTNKFLAPTEEGPFGVAGVNYQYRVSVSFPPAPAVVKLLRVRAIYSGTSFAVSGTSNLPRQGVLVESTGYYADIRRKIEVVRTDPALSELFDFVYFSGSQPIAP